MLVGNIWSRCVSGGHIAALRCGYLEYRWAEVQSLGAIRSMRWSVDWLVLGDNCRWIKLSGSDFTVVELAERVFCYIQKKGKRNVVAMLTVKPVALKSFPRSQCGHQNLYPWWSQLGTEPVCMAAFEPLLGPVSSSLCVAALASWNANGGLY